MHTAPSTLSAQDPQISRSRPAHQVVIIFGMADSFTTTTEKLTPTLPPDPRRRASADASSATPVDPPPPTGPRLSAPVLPPSPLPRGWLAASLVVGVCATLVIGRAPVSSLGTAALITVIASALWLTRAVTSRPAGWSLIAAVGFALCLVVRTDPRLVAFNLIAAGLALVVAVIGPERVLDWRPLQLLNDVCSIAFQPFVLLGEFSTRSHLGDVGARPGRSKRRQLLVGILQGAVIAAPLLIVFAALLGSADVVFADLISRGQFDAGQLWYTTLRFAVGAIAMVTLLGRTVRSRSEAPLLGLSLDRTPTLVVLGALNAIFALFVAAQLYALTGAGERILAEAGLTYSDYARQGFFQLLWVSGLTLLVLLSLRSASSGWSRADRWFRSSSLLTVVLTIGVVVVAVARLQLYIADFGLTPLRFYSLVFSVWVAFGFAIVAGRLVGWKSAHAWTLPAVVLSGLVVLVGLNITNPEARIANDLVGRSDIASAVEQLTSDGRYVMAERLDEVDQVSAPEVGRVLCTDVPNDTGWLSWNLGRSRARSVLLELC